MPFGPLVSWSRVYGFMPFGPLASGFRVYRASGFMLF